MERHTYAVTMLYERTKNAACICIYLKYYVVSMLMSLNPIIVYMKTPYEPSDKAVTELRSHGNEIELSSTVNIPFLLQFSIQLHVQSFEK